MWGKFCAYFVLPLLFSGFLAMVFVYSSPGSTVVEGNAGTVRIDRDSWGIPHIYAEDMDDAVYGLGFAMCQDRMWQLDMLRRVATGRLSEVFGMSTFETDKFVRNAKFPIAARNDVNLFDAKTKSLNLNFIKGINDAASQSWLPLEYYLTWSKWENFTEIDPQSTIYSTSIYLSMIWGSDLIKLQLKSLNLDADSLIPSDLHLLNPKTFCISNDELPPSLKGPKENLKSSEFKDHIDFYTELFDLGSGSNAWVISGNHTKSGKPLLSSDPHLSTTVPSLWYLHHITIKDYSVYGAASIGYPMTIVGRNNRFAWGVTALKVDDIDIYAEKMINETHYWFGKEQFEFLSYEEVIRVKGGNDVVVRFKESVHGPLLDNGVVGVKKFTPNFPETDAKLFTFCWSSLGFSDKSMSFMNGVMGARNIEEFRNLFSKTSAVRLAIVAGSVDGDILFQAVGKFPVKRYKGDIVLPGWTPETMWKGFIPFSDLPYTINPSKGFIVSANNFVTGSDYKYSESLGTYNSQGRSDRLTDLISSKIHSGHKFTSEDNLSFLTDEFDTFAKTSLPTVLSKVKPNPKYSKALELLKSWDYQMTKTSQAAAIYARWYIEISKNLLKNKAPEYLIQSYTRNQVIHSSLYNFFLPHYNDLEPHCDNLNTAQVETCSDLISEALERAVDYVGDQNWGNLHAVVLKHLPFSQSRLLSWFFERKTEVGGWTSSVHATSSDWNSTFNTVHGPGLKFVSDLGNSSSNFWAIESGMSGNVFSPHYSDMFQIFHYGEIPRFEYN